MAAIDDLLAKLGEIAMTTQAINDKRGLLDGYRATRQQYADLVVSTKTELDALVAASEAQLKALRDALNAAFPPPPA